MVTVDAVTLDLPGYPYFVGEFGTNNFLSVTNAGGITSAGIKVGGSAEANNNRMVVTGPGSSYYSSGGLTIGSSGSYNSLLIEDGATVTNNEAYVGALFESRGNEAIVTGEGSVWTAQKLDVGWSGSENRLLISESGAVNAVGNIGDNGGSSNNVVEISGSGSVWNGGLSVGPYGTGNRVSILDGGTLRGGVALGSADWASNNVVQVFGPESTIDDPSGTVEVSYSGSSNTLEIAGGGSVTAWNGFVNRGNSGVANNNLILVRDPGSRLSFRDRLQMWPTGTNNLLVVKGEAELVTKDMDLGGSASNQLRLEGGYFEVQGFFGLTGGTFYVGGGTAWIEGIGFNYGRSGHIEIAGGTVFVNSSTSLPLGSEPLVIGTLAGETASLILASGNHEIRTTAGILVGSATNSHGELFVAGSRSLIAGPLFVGATGASSGSGVVNLSEGATLETAMLVAGSGGSGWVINDGGAFQFTTATPNIQSLSPRAISLKNGEVAFVDATNVELESVADSPSGLSLLGSNALRLIRSNNKPVASVTFSDATPTNYQRLVLEGDGASLAAQQIEVGHGAIAILTNGAVNLGTDGGEILVKDGGQVVQEQASLNGDTGNQRIMLTGDYTMWTNRTLFALGGTGGMNSISISNGAALHCQDVSLGRTVASASNQVTLGGFGASLIAARDITVGERGSSNRLVMDGGTVRAGSSVLLGRFSTSTGNEIIINGGLLAVTNVAKLGQLNMQAGQLVMNDGQIEVDTLNVAAGPTGDLIFNGGTIEAFRVTHINGRRLIIGDGIHPAVLHLKGGTNTFAGGLVIAPNASVVGAGTILGVVTNLGVVQAEGGALNFQDTVINSGVILNGSGAQVTLTGGLVFGVLSADRLVDHFSVSVGRVDGQVFSLEYRRAIAGQNWLPADFTTMLESNIVWLTDTNTNGSMRFYRVKLE